MAQFRTIEIDFDVHKLIENERRGFEEAPNNALRRLLGLPEAVPDTNRRLAEYAQPLTDATEGPVLETNRALAEAARASWWDKGVMLPNGTSVRMKYNSRTYEGRIHNGKWVIGDQSFDSPSAAAGVAITRKGTTTALNGWLYWEVRVPGEDHWVHLSTLRPKGRVVDSIDLPVEEPGL